MGTEQPVITVTEQPMITVTEQPVMVSVGDLILIAPPGFGDQIKKKPNLDFMSIAPSKFQDFYTEFMLCVPEKYQRRVDKAFETYILDGIYHPNMYQCLRLGCMNLPTLPDMMKLAINGSLDLQGNNLTSLPDSFGQLHVSGDLLLNSNQLESLPDSFGQLRVGGNLWLCSNKIKTLPESFGQLRVGGNLLLNSNRLESLPDSFAQLRVGGQINLVNNARLDNDDEASHCCMQ